MKNNSGKILKLFVIGAAILGSLSAYAQVIPCFPAPNGVVAWWKAESNALDSVGSNHGTWHGGPAYTNGEVNAAFNFYGTNYINVPYTNALNFTNTMTVEAWINLRSFSGAGWREIVSKYGATGSLDCWTLTIDPGQQKAVFIVNPVSGSSDGIAYSSTTIPLGEWTHIAGVYDGATVKIYINGVISSATSWSSGIRSANSDITIGCTMQSSPTSYFNGQIDEVTLYNTALTDCDIQSIYLMGMQGKCP